MSLILLLLGAAMGADHGTLGLQGGLVAVEGSAAPDVDGQVGAWITWAPRPWGLALDLAGWRHVDGAKPFDRGSLYRMSRVQARGALLVEVALGTHATTFHAGLGPALGYTVARARFGDRDVSTALLEPGIAGRVALDGPLVGPLAWQWRVGVTSRALARVDYDTAIGLGVCW